MTDKKFKIVCSCGESIEYDADNAIYASVNNSGNITINTTWEDTVVIRCGKCGNKTRLPHALAS